VIRLLMRLLMNLAHFFSLWRKGEGLKCSLARLTVALRLRALIKAGKRVGGMCTFQSRPGKSDPAITRNSTESTRSFTPAIK
jgi:hypothetical protein